MIGAEGEHLPGLAGWDPAQLRDLHLHHKAPTRFQVRGRVGEDRQRPSVWRPDSTPRDRVCQISWSELGEPPA